MIYKKNYITDFWHHKPYRCKLWDFKTWFIRVINHSYSFFLAVSQKYIPVGQRCLFFFPLFFWTVLNERISHAYSRRAIVEELEGLGATVHTCSENEVDLNKCLNEWEKLNLGITGSVCDVSSRLEREKLIETVSSLFNRKLDILVCAW